MVFREILPNLLYGKHFLYTSFISQIIHFLAQAVVC
jgi:hypothetical protein